MTEIDELSVKIADALKRWMIVRSPKERAELIKSSEFRIVDGMIETSWVFGSITYRPLIEILDVANMSESLIADIKLYLNLAGKPDQYYLDLYMKGRHDPSFRIL